MELPIAILAGGLATRLRPITERIPKSLVEVAGRPFIEHQLALLRRAGVERVVLCVGHLGEQIEAHIGNGHAFGIDVAYSYDGPALCGTAGALRRALPLLGPAFMVLYGDSYLDVDYAGIAQEFADRQLPALMTVYRNAGQWDRSNVLFDAGRILRYDKRDPVPEMQHIDYGLSVLRADTLSAVPENRPADLADLFRQLVATGQMAGVEVSTRFYEIGSPTGLQEAAHYLSMQEEIKMSFYAEQHLEEAAEILSRLDRLAMERMARLLVDLRAREGRLFILGVGGGAGHASHAVNDFRKIVGIECYAPTDNVSELTARVNDEGWDTTFSQWLLGSRLRASDMLLVFSVGGGSLEHNISPNLVRALQYAQQVGAGIIGIVGRDGGYTARVADACVVVPTVNSATVTPHTEAFQAVIWHLLVSHPLLQITSTKWEALGTTEALGTAVAGADLVQAVVGQGGVALSNVA